MKKQMKTEILKLKEAKNAVILAHYYAPDEIQEIADYVGDSFYLAKVAKKSTADIIVFCGVYFMGESAKILDLCQYFGQKKLKGYPVFFSSSSSFC